MSTFKEPWKARFAIGEKVLYGLDIVTIAEVRTWGVYIIHLGDHSKIYTAEEGLCPLDGYTIARELAK